MIWLLCCDIVNFVVVYLRVFVYLIRFLVLGLRVECCFVVLLLSLIVFYLWCWFSGIVLLMIGLWRVWFALFGCCVWVFVLRCFVRLMCVVCWVFYYLVCFVIDGCVMAVGNSVA